MLFVLTWIVRNLSVIVL